MADDVRCDHCHKSGRRPRMYPAPRDWLYLEATDDECAKNTLIVFACSDACALALWKKGPGDRFSVDEVLNA